MPTVGEILKAERERQGLQINDIEKAISIRSFYLNAIEEGNYDLIPGEVYLKGFIRNYANQLGLDAQEILDIYHQTKAAPNSASPVDDSGNVNSETVSPKPRRSSLKAKRLEREKDKRKSQGSSVKWIAALIIAIMGMGMAAWWAVAQFKMPEPFNSALEEQKEEAPSQPNNQAPAPTAPTNQANQTNPSAVPPATPKTSPETTAIKEKDVVVSTNFKSQCWIQVNVDGKLEYEGIPKTGDTLTFSGNQKIFIKFGNAGAADITHNGKLLGIAGAPGDVVIKTFTKDAVSTVNLR